MLSNINYRLLHCHFKSIFFSLYAPITDECNAWFHWYAVSPGARNTEQAKITDWKKIVHSRIRTHDIQLMSISSLPHIQNSIVIDVKIKCPFMSVNVFIYTVYK